MVKKSSVKQVGTLTVCQYLLIGEAIHPATPIGLALIVAALLIQQLKYGKRYRKTTEPQA